MAIIGILITLAIPRFVGAVKHAREAALKEDLQTMRTAIDTYTMDKQKAPQSLDDLVQDGYLRAIPEDPMTRQQRHLGHRHQRRHVLARRDRARHHRRPLRLDRNRQRRTALFFLVNLGIISLRFFALSKPLKMHNRALSSRARPRSKSVSIEDRPRGRPSQSNGNLLLPFAGGKPVCHLSAPSSASCVPRFYAPAFTPNRKTPFTSACSTAKPACP